MGKGFFSSSQRKFHFHYMTLFEELLNLLGLKVEIVSAGLKADSYCFSFLFFWLASFFLFPLFAIHIFTIIHNFGNRRLRLKRNLNQVQIFLPGQIQGVLYRQNSKLPAFLIYDLKLSG